VIVDEAWSGTSDVVGVSLDDAADVVRHDLTAPDAPSLFCNDLLVDADGNVWVTESLAGIIHRIDAADVMTENSAEIWMRGGLATPPAGGFGPNGLALAGDTLVVANVGKARCSRSTQPADDDRRSMSAHAAMLHTVSGKLVPRSGTLILHGRTQLPPTPVPSAFMPKPST
jgi:sugar lactone lactonase YvrE